MQSQSIPPTNAKRPHTSLNLQNKPALLGDRPIRGSAMELLACSETLQVSPKKPSGFVAEQAGGQQEKGENHMRPWWVESLLGGEIGKYRFINLANYLRGCPRKSKDDPQVSSRGSAVWQMLLNHVLFKKCLREKPTTTDCA